MLNNNSFHSRIGSGSVFALRCDPAFQSTFKRDRLCLVPRRFSEATAAGIAGRLVRSMAHFERKSANHMYRRP